MDSNTVEHRARRCLSLGLLSLSLGACELLTDAGPQLPDGDYRLSLSAPRFEQPLITPGWMTDLVLLDFTRSGDQLTITASQGSIVSEGSAQRFEAAAEGWLLEFAVAGREDGFHYWSVEITDETCTMAQAVDADLPTTENGLTVSFTACFISKR